MIFLYLASSLYMAGLIWFVQVVHYPLFEAVKDASGEYYRLHSKKTSRVVILPMIVQLVCAILFVIEPGDLGATTSRVLLLIVVLIWIATFGLAVPQHNVLAKGYDEPAVRRLVATNWIRTSLWSGHAVWLMWTVASWMKDKG